MCNASSCPLTQHLDTSVRALGCVFGANISRSLTYNSVFLDRSSDIWSPVLQQASPQRTRWTEQVGESVICLLHTHSKSEGTCRSCKWNICLIVWWHIFTEHSYSQEGIWAENSVWKLGSQLLKVNPRQLISVNQWDRRGTTLGFTTPKATPKHKFKPWNFSIHAKCPFLCEKDAVVAFLCM